MSAWYCLVVAAPVDRTQLLYVCLSLAAMAMLASCTPGGCKHLHKEKPSAYTCCCCLIRRPDLSASATPGKASSCGGQQAAHPS